MHHIFGREFQRLILAITGLMMVLALAIIAFFIVEVSVTTRRNIERNRELMISESVLMLQELSDTVGRMNSNTRFFGNFKPEVVQDCLTRPQAVYDLILDIGSTFYPIEYISIISDGETIDSRCLNGDNVDPSTVPVSSDGSYATFDRLGQSEGFFISVSNPLKLSAFGAGKDVMLDMVVDRRMELNQIETYFNQQRHDLLLALYLGGAIFILLTLAVTTFGLRHYTYKYVTQPLEKLNHTAEEIVDGTFEGEVEVDPGSAFAALQGLLQSGQKMLCSLDKMEWKGDGPD